MDKERKAHKKIKLYMCNECGAIKTHKTHECIFGHGYTVTEGEAVFPAEE